MERATKRFVCRYHHDGAWWSVVIDAYDWADAEARARRLSMQIDGELVATIPARMGWLVRIGLALANFFRRKP